MRIFEMMGALVAVGLISACGPERSKKTIHGRESGEVVTMASGPNVAAPRNLPAYAPLYPGAVIETSVDGVSSDADGGRRGGMVGFHTDDNPQTVAEFYRARLNASGLTDRGEANMNGAVVLTAAAADDSGHGVQVSVAPAPDGTGSAVSLIYSGGNG